MYILLRNLACISLFTSLISCRDKVGKTEDAPARPPLSVKAFVVKGESFANDLSATADMLASEQVEMKAPLSGTVLGIYFNEGQYISQGQSIIKLDDRAWKAQLIGLNSQLANAEKDLKRKKDLLSIQGSSQEEIDQVSTSIETLKSQIAQLQVNINLANVKAPFSGQMGMRDFSLGAYLKEGDMISTLSATQSLKVDFSIPQEYSTTIKISKSIKVLLGKDTLNAIIYAIDPVIDAGSRTIHVRARLNQPKGKNILPGTYAEVLLSTDLIPNALMLPTQAIVPEIEDQTVYIYKEGKVIRKVVQLGTRTDEKVHILSGISLGDTIITTGLLQIKDGASVNLQEIK